MATKTVCLLFCCCYPLLASEASGIASVIYPAKISSQCGEDNPLKDGQITEALRQIRQQEICANATVAEGVPLVLTINNTVYFSIVASDCARNDVATGGDNVTATLTSVDYPSCVSPEPTVVDNGNGSYQVSLTPECSGNNLVSVSINGKTIRDMPVTVAVIPPYTSLRRKQKIVGVNWPYDIDIAENADVFVGSWSDHHVHHFDIKGMKLNSWRAPGGRIGGVLVHNDNIYLSQCSPPKLYNYTRNGNLIGSVFNDACCWDLELGPDGKLYRADTSNRQISIFSLEDGSLLDQITGLTGSPNSIAFDLDGKLHLTTYLSPVIRVFNCSSGVLLRNYTLPNSSSSRNDGIYIDKAGNVLVVDGTLPSKVIITDKNNNLLHKLVRETQKTYAEGNIAIAPNGDVWVTNEENIIEIFSA